MKTSLVNVVVAGWVWLLGGGSVQAAATQFKVTTGDWNNAANWSAGLPIINEADVGSASASPATATINPGDDLTSGVLIVGQYAGQVGTVNQSGGALNLQTNYLRVGAAGVGTYNLSGGYVSNATLYVAVSGGTGTVNISGGSMNGCGGTSESAIVGRNANSYGHVVQTDGLFSLNVSTNTADLTIGRDSGVGLYELSGGVVTNVGTLYLGLAAISKSHPLGTLILSGSGVLYGTKGMYLGYGYTATGVVQQTGGLCQPGGLRIGCTASGNRGVGRYEMSGGVFSGALYVGDGGIGTLLISSNAVMDTSFVNVGATWSTTGTVFQTGGRVDTHANSIAIGKETGGHGEYVLSGGSVSNVQTITIGSSGGVGVLSLGGSAVLGMWTNSADHYITVAGNSASTGTLQIEGKDVTISGVSNFNNLQPRSTLDFLFESEGISTLPVGWTANLGGTLSLGLRGGVSLFQTNAFLLINSSGISGDFSVKNTSVFTATTNGTKKYVSTLDEAQKLSATTLSRSGQSVSFTPVNRGWVTTAVSIRKGPFFDLALDVTSVGSPSETELVDLGNFFSQGGLTVKRINPTWSGSNVILTFPTSVDGVTNNLAWDLSRFDSDLRVSTITIIDNNSGTVLCIR